MRVLVSLLVALLSGGLVYAFEIRHPEQVSDFVQFWVGARALVAGADPYTVVPTAYPFPLYYPLPAVVLVAPLAGFEMPVARGIFAGVGGFALTLAATKTHQWRGLYLIASGAYLNALQLGQWAPLLAAAVVFPWLGGLIAVKPNIGGAVIAGQRGRYEAGVAVAVAAVFTLATLAIDPQWPARWLETMRSAPHIRPYVLLPGGFLLLLAGFRWRDPAARALLALAVIPATPGVHETLVLMILVRDRVWLLALAILSHVPRLLLPLYHHAPDFPSYMHGVGTLVLWSVLMPALVMVLREHVMEVKHRRCGDGSGVMEESADLDALHTELDRLVGASEEEPRGGVVLVPGPRTCDGILGDAVDVNGQRFGNVVMRIPDREGCPGRDRGR
jgi:hypothetical protein